MKTLNKIILTLITLGLVLGVTNLYKQFKTYEYSISGIIDFNAAEKFKQFLIGKGKNNTLIIHIESPGGYVISEHKMEYYLDKTEATTICYVDSHAMSAAAMIFMHCKHKHATPKAQILFHVIQICTDVSPISGQCTKYSPVSPTFRPDLYEESIKELQIVKPILTKEEWNKLLQGNDITILGDDFMKRTRGVK